MKAYPVTKTFIDDLQLTQFRILFISKSMQIKTIAENIHALYIYIYIQLHVHRRSQDSALLAVKERNRPVGELLKS